MSPVTRRRFISAGAGVAVAAMLPRPVARGLTIFPRDTWGADLPPKGPLEPEDVEFLIVHHSAGRNGHTAEDVPGILRSWYNYHTGPDKGWNDIAYNFVIDSEGGIWEGRQGSIDGPVAGDATGGNQGYTQLVCVIGDFNTAQPTQASLSSLVRVLAWLADRYDVSTAPGAEVTFVSEGSNRWPEGTSVTTPTITGHRTMSKTTCPGDNLYAYVAGSLTADVEAVRNGASPSSPTTAPEATTTTPPPSTTTTTPPPSTTTTNPPTSTTTTAASTTTSPAPSSSPPASTTVPPTTTPSISAPSTTPPPSVPPTTVPVAGSEPLVSQGSSPLLIGAGTLVALGSGLLIWRYNRLNR